MTDSDKRAEVRVESQGAASAGSTGSPGSRWIARGFIAALVLGLCAAYLVSARGEDNPVMSLLTETPGSSYQASCRDKAADFEASVRERRYIPPRLTIRRWADKAESEGQSIHETTFVSWLSRGQTTWTLIEARGGLGKSMLAGAIESRLCAALPVFRVDIGLDIAPRIAKGTLRDDTLERIISKRAGLRRDKAQLASLRAALSESAFVLLVDSLDEVAVDLRPQVIEVLRSVQARYPSAIVTIFSRPPVFASNGGFDEVDAWLSLSPLGCEASRERIQARLKEGKKVSAFWDFASKTGLDRALKSPLTHAGDGTTTDHCEYVHMATYRDAKVVADVARSLAFEAPEGFEASRAKVYHAYVLALLRAAQTPTLDPKALLEIVRAIIAMTSPEGGTRAITMARADCEASASAAAIPDARMFCKRLLSSRLFEPLASKPLVRFRNQSITDYFLADWANARIAEGDGPLCERVAGFAKLFESNEVASFLVGMPVGERCATEIIQALCASGSDTASSYALMEQGFSGDTDRQALLEQWRKRSPGEDTRAAACVEDILTRLAEAKPAVAQ